MYSLSNLLSYSTACLLCIVYEFLVSIFSTWCVSLPLLITCCRAVTLTANNMSCFTSKKFCMFHIDLPFHLTTVTSLYLRHTACSICQYRKIISSYLLYPVKRPLAFQPINACTPLTLEIPRDLDVAMSITTL